MTSGVIDREEELKMLGFLAILAGLLGVVVSLSQFEVGETTSLTVRAYFTVILVIFMFVSVITYLAALQDKDITQLNMAVIGYFSTLLGLVIGLALASVTKNVYEFWIVGLFASVLFYLALQRLQKNLKWNATVH